MTLVMERCDDDDQLNYRSDVVVHESTPKYVKDQPRSDDEEKDALPILFRLYKLIETMFISDDAEVIGDETIMELEAKKLLRVPRACTSICSTLVIEVLNDMNVPEDEQETIRGKVFEAFPRNHHELPAVTVMVVDIYEVTLQRRAVPHEALLSEFYELS